MRRAADIAVAATGLVLLSPVLLLAIIAIRLESKGGAFYRQRRVGLDGREFDVLKLRTMVDGAEHIGAGLAVNAGDARITRVGKVLRRASLDELPNLINVLRGEMARRPHVAAVGAADRARPLVHRAPHVAAGPADPLAQRAHGLRRRGPLQGDDGRLDAAVAAVRGRS